MAVSENITVAPAVQRQRPGPAITNIDPAGLPDHYGMRVSGNCMLPEIADEDLLRFDKREPVKAGDVVIIYFQPKFIAPGEPLYLGLMLAELTHPRRQQLAYACSSILAIHKCMGHLSEEQVSEKIPTPLLKPARARRARKTGVAHV